jgi:hypothetical protein
MKLSNRERKLCDSFYKSVLAGKILPGFNFDEEALHELKISLESREIKDSFLYLDYIVKGLGAKDLMNPKLWLNPLFLDAMKGTAVAVNRVVYRIPEKTSEKDVPDWFDDLESSHPMIKIKRR